jgi:hypothetical protein
MYVVNDGTPGRIIDEIFKYQSQPMVNSDNYMIILTRQDTVVYHEQIPYSKLQFTSKLVAKEDSEYLHAFTNHTSFRIRKITSSSVIDLVEI